jgi:hypothetical protein
MDGARKEKKWGASPAIPSTSLEELPDFLAVLFLSRNLVLLLLGFLAFLIAAIPMIRSCYPLKRLP